MPEVAPAVATAAEAVLRPAEAAVAVQLPAAEAVLRPDLAAAEAEMPEFAPEAEIEATSEMEREAEAALGWPAQRVSVTEKQSLP